MKTIILREYISWRQMRRRCLAPRSKDYKNWGARGIGICERWNSFPAFLADMGPRPVGYTLDRRDNSKGYSPDNCRWATIVEQRRNTRHVKLNTEAAKVIRHIYGRGVSSVRLAAIFSVSQRTVLNVTEGVRWQ